MALTRTNIIGRITLPDDTNPVNSVVRFVMTGFDTDDIENATVIQIPIDAPIDALGDIDVDLWPNPLGVRSTFYATYVRIPDGNTNDVINVYVGQISVPATGGPYDLNDLLPIAPPAGADVADYIAQLAAAVASAEAAAVSTAADAVATAADAEATAADAIATAADAVDTAAALAAVQAISSVGYTGAPGGPADIASTANLTLSGEQTIDGVLTSATRILVKDQTAPAENGLYVTGAGAWVRATDMDQAGEFLRKSVSVSGGDTNIGRTYGCASTVTTVGTDPVLFTLLIDQGVFQTQIETRIDVIRAANLLLDPFMRTLPQNKFINDDEAAYLGVLVPQSVDSPVDNGSAISNTGTGQVRRAVSLPDSLEVGDTVTFSILATASGATQFTVIFRTITGSIISTVNASGTFTGTNIEQSVTTTIPATTAFFQFALTSGVSSDKKLLGTFLSKGLQLPEPIDAPVFVRQSGILNQYPDPLFQFATAGVSEIDGYPLTGRNVAAAALVAAPVESPFLTQVVSLPSGSSAHEFSVKADRLSFEAGKNLSINVGYIYLGKITTSFFFYDATDTLIDSDVVTIDCRSPVDLAVKIYNQMRLDVLITDALMATDYVVIRSFSGGATTSEAFIVGVSIADQPHDISTQDTSLVQTSIKASSAIPSRVLGKKIAIFGDSIPGNTINIDAGLNWRMDDYMAAEILANVSNFAIGGTTWAARASAQYNPFSMSALADAILSGDFTDQDAQIGLFGSLDQGRLTELKATDFSTVDCILVMHGTNDYGAEQKPIGIITDTTDATFYGAINNALSKLQLAAPQARLILTAPIWRDRFDTSFAGVADISGTTMTVTSASKTTLAVGDTIYARGINTRTKVTAFGTGTGGTGTYNLDTAWTLSGVAATGVDATENGRDFANSQGHTLDDYSEALKIAAAQWGIPVVDLMQEIGWGVGNVAYWGEDGVHPNGYFGLPVLSRFMSREIGLLV